MAKEFKPNLKWLQKVADGGVMHVAGYSMRKGGYTRFIGGEASYKKHRDAGYVGWCPGGSLGRPGILQLTEKGVDALRNEKSS